MTVPGDRSVAGRHLAVVGPTAAGKSALALAVARAVPGTEIVSVDSMAVYRGMDVATAKPSPAERAEVPHHLVDVADPGEEYGVARFQVEGRAVLADLERRGRRAVLVGGTGLYLRALVDDLRMPGRWPALAAQLDEEAGRPGGLAACYRRLQALDPAAAGRIEPGNRRRIVRALEVTLGSGRPFSSFGPGLTRYPPTPVVMVGLGTDRAQLDLRIEERLHRWMGEGLLDEVRTLAGRPGGLSRTARQAVAYRELLAHVEDGLPLAQAVTDAVARTRLLARRQMAWFRRDPRVHWVVPGADALAAALACWEAGVPAEGASVIGVPA